MKILFLNGGAAVRGRDNAYLEFDDPEAFLGRGGINLGDMLVYDATLKLIAFEGIGNIQFREDWRKRDLDRINDEYDLCVIRGSNYFSEGNDLGDLVPLVEALRMPIVPIGVGVQAASYKRLQLPAGTRRFLAAVAERCSAIGVRGAYSAEALSEAGVKNLSIVGCPSIFRGLQPTLRVRKKPFADDLAVGLTLNKYLAGEYAEDQIKTLRLQRRILLSLAGLPRSVLYSQGERDEFILANRLRAREEEALGSILSKFSLSMQDEAAVEFLKARTKVFLDIESWAQDVAGLDFMIGFRLHGNVMALHQGIPAVFYTYDSRVREIAELFHMPFIDVAPFRRFELADIYAATDFAAFEAAYARQYRHMAAFLEANGVPHRMKPGAPSDRPVVGSAEPPLGQPILLPPHAADLDDWYDGEIAWMSQEIARLRARDWTLTKRVQDLQRVTGDGAAAPDVSASAA